MEVRLFIRYLLIDELGEREDTLSITVPEEVASSLIDYGQDSPYFYGVERIIDDVAFVCRYAYGKTIEVIDASL